MTNQTNDNVELEQTEATVSREMYKALELLEDKNTEAGKAFELLITDGYLKKKAIEYTSLLATEYIRGIGRRGVIMEELVAISAFEQYLLDVKTLGAPPVEDDEDFEYADGN